MINKLKLIKIIKDDDEYEFKNLVEQSINQNNLSFEQLIEKLLTEDIDNITFDDIPIKTYFEGIIYSNSRDIFKYIINNIETDILLDIKIENKNILEYIIYYNEFFMFETFLYEKLYDLNITKEFLESLTSLKSNIYSKLNIINYIDSVNEYIYKTIKKEYESIDKLKTESNSFKELQNAYNDIENKYKKFNKILKNTIENIQKENAPITLQH